MSHELLQALGLASGVLSVLAYLPYIKDTLSGATRPKRASWLIWSVLSIIAFFSQVYEGASHSLWFAGAQMSGTVTVFVISIWRGTGELTRKGDYWVLVAAALGLVLWYFTSSAAYALTITIGISLLGGALTVCKSYRAPNSETMSTWGLSFVAAICAILAVGSVDWLLLAYPIYLFVLNGAIVAALLIGRSRDAQAGQTASASGL